MAVNQETGSTAAHDVEAERAFVAIQLRTPSGAARVESSAVDLDDAIDVWRKLIQMLSGAPVVIRRLETASLRPALEAEPGEGVVAMPARIEWLPRAQGNRRAYRFLAWQLTGRRQFGTYARGAELVARLRRGGERPTAVEEVFLIAEGVRVAARMAQAYPGARLETEQLAVSVLESWQNEPRPSFARACDVLLALALAGGAVKRLPVWLPAQAAERVLTLLEPLRGDGASVHDALQVGRQLLRLLSEPVLKQSLESGAEAPLDELADADLFEVASDGGSLQAEAELDASDELLAGAPPPEQRSAEPQPKSGGSAPLIDGSSEDAQRPAAPSVVPAEPVSRIPARLRRTPQPPAQTYLYDEWDHTLADYRRRCCRVHEIPAAHDSGQFFAHAQQTHRAMLAEVRRHFERMRPERYRVRRRLQDGEDFDLNELIEHRIDLRARRTPSERVYTARVRQARDVATLFLLDMSASTEQPYVEPGEPAQRRIIDTLKETLVVMSSALGELGDSYAIYGFSSQGPDQVEVYPIKSFHEGLSRAVQERIGGIAPKSGTRMGAALRHVIRKFAAVHATSRHLILLSDGYPQDHAYGPDRHSRTYGIEDTAVALREVRAAGVAPLCITVDRAGHDYLRLMCDASQYLVIDDVEALSRELPKIYGRVVQSPRTPAYRAPD